MSIYKFNLLFQRKLKSTLTMLLLFVNFSVDSAPITFNTALPVAKGEYLVREQLVINQSGDDPLGVNRDRTEKIAVTALGYGINRHWAVYCAYQFPF